MRAALYCSALAFAVLVEGCGKSGCPDKQTSCFGVCTDTSIDAQNCGTCGTACSPGLSCTNGTCGLACATGTTACDGLCVNTDTDLTNCGTCGNACSPGQTCRSGVCSCAAGATICGGDDAGLGGACANLSTDSANCGRCGFACPVGSLCNGNGACAADCAAGFSACTSDGGQAYCADFTNDNSNCGSCGAPCPPGEACSASQCAPTCAPGYSSCNSDGGVGTCANFLTDSLNCGDCGKACPGGTACSNGSCAATCASGFTPCSDGGYCANFLTDSNNCGSCGNACPSGETCQGGNCAESCAAGFNACTLDGGEQFCADFLTDNANCGRCGRACAAGQVCDGTGTCTVTCGAGYTVCTPASGQTYCAKLTNDRLNCGTCGKICSAGQLCQSSNCTETCGNGYTACGSGTTAYCANIQADSNNCGACGTVCPGGQSCNGSGKCALSCPKGYNSCGSGTYCADLTEDVNNCGTCGTNCGDSFDAPGCCNSTCTSLASGDPNNCGTCGNACGGTEPGCCGAQCTDESTDRFNCGGCGTVCSSGVKPSCCPDSSSNGSCTDSWTDTNNCGGCGNVCASGHCAGQCCTSACEVDSTTNCYGSCDGQGTCHHPTCATGYGCALGSACKTSCASAVDCAPGYTCRNPPSGSCCLPLTAGATLYVDGKLGSDANCCTSASNACQTLTHVMSVISAAGVSGVTINVAWNNKPSVQADWAPSNGETYPIHLGWGVTVKAPGIFFTPAAPSSGTSTTDVFDVYAYTAADTGTVTIEGDPNTDFMYIGFDSTQTNLTGASIAVNDGVSGQTAVPVTLSNVWMNAQTEALNVGAGGTASLGPNPVIIGSGANTAKPLTAVSSPGIGIYCQGTSTSHATVKDVSGGSGSVLEIDQQDTGHTQLTDGLMDINDYCDLTLTQKPVLGLPPPCQNPKVDGEGILVYGSATVSLKNATIQCMYNHGMDIGETPTNFTGHPTVALDKTLIQYTGQTALKINDGAVGPVTNSSIFHSRFGVILQQVATLDLSGGGNTLACNTSQEPGAYNAGGSTTPAVNLWNETAAQSIDASNNNWDNNPPGYWTCTDPPNTTSANACTCASGTCVGANIQVPDSADAVTAANTSPTPIILNNPSLQSTFTCN